MLMDEPMEPYIRKQRGDRNAAASLLRNKKIASEREVCVYSFYYNYEKDFRYK